MTKILLFYELQQDFPSVVPPPPEFGLRNQTPILAPPPEFSDARDTHEAATRFNQGHMFSAEHQQQLALQQQQQQFNRASPMYRSIRYSIFQLTVSISYLPHDIMTREKTPIKICKIVYKTVVDVWV